MDRLKDILVTVDFSSCSADALRQAIRLGAWNKANVRALHVVSAPPAPPGRPFVPYDPPSDDDLVNDVWRRWENFAPGGERKGEVAFDVMLGNPRDEILRRVRETSPDLLVMGAHSTRDRKRGIGTTASACVRHAETRVLLVREEQVGPFSKVLSCIDFSPTSLAALEQAVRVAAQDSAELHILHIHENPWGGMAAPARIEADMPAFKAALRAAAEERLREFCRPLAHETNALKAVFHAAEREGGWAGFGRGINDFIAGEGIDLAVLGVRSRWNVRDLVMGSTAERVVRDGGCSVLTVRPVPEEGAGAPV